MTPDATTFMLAGLRWAGYASLLGVVGAAGAHLVIARSSDPALSAVAPHVGRRVARNAVTLASAWTLTLVGLLVANLIAWFGTEGFTRLENVRLMLFDTTWGHSWMLACAGAATATAASVAAMVRPSARGPLHVVAAAAVVTTTPLIGHAGGAGGGIWVLHTAHLAGAGLWLGTLLMLLWAAPALWRTTPASPAALGQLLRRFTPVALAGAGVAVSSGVLIAVQRVWPPASVFETAYGVTLGLKVSAVAVIAGFGWLNWRRLGPRATDPAGRQRLRTSATIELTLGFGVVLLLTAWLTGLPSPE